MHLDLRNIGALDVSISLQRDADFSCSTQGEQPIIADGSGTSLFVTRLQRSADACDGLDMGHGLI